MNTDSRNVLVSGPGRLVLPFVNRSGSVKMVGTGPDGRFDHGR